jgi:hypothetical protein
VLESTWHQLRPSPAFYCFTTPNWVSWTKCYTVDDRFWPKAAQRLNASALLRGNQQALDELSAEDLDPMAETVVAAALSGKIWAAQEIARAIDE